MTLTYPFFRSSVLFCLLTDMYRACSVKNNTGKGKSFIANSLRDPELEPKNAIELPVEHLDSRHKTALEIDPNASSLKMDIKKENRIGNCPLSEHHVATVGVSHTQMDKRELKKVVDASELDNTSSNDSKLCVVERSLKRLRGLGESGITSQDDRNVLRRSELSAFSRLGDKNYLLCFLSYSYMLSRVSFSYMLSRVSFTFFLEWNVGSFIFPRWLYDFAGIIHPRILQGLLTRSLEVVL